ncbi:hypothetical protein FPCIR_11920 [Fusarium pseudocircinatum]|uniref:Uncharacterized protein n=1 Tax=Fusarium pseudocircinatum TaxID=56676 RepID=A0A8H5NT29_9HYPO|nr:hypothetical protein FPCIR_11920 [Fusarium pseudocircinatum]
MASSHFAAGAEYILPYSFPDEEHRCEDPVQREDQKAKVRAAFEQAKKVMSQQAIAELFDYLQRGEWIHTAERASSHTAYRNFMGRNGRDRDDPDIHVAVRNLYETASRHWGMKATPGVPFFPRLQDSDRELRLLVGNHPIRSKTVGRSDPSPFLTTPLASRPSPRPEVQESGFQNTQDSIIVSPSAPSTSSNSARPAPNLPSISPYVADINMKFLEKEQRITDLERKLKEKEQELKDKDCQMDLGYKQRYEQAQEQKMETQRALRDTRQRCRELEMLINKYEEKSKQLKHELLQSQENSTRSLTAALQAQGLLGLSQQQLDKSLSLMNEPIEEFNATPEGAGFAAHDDQRANKRARES